MISTASGVATTLEIDTINYRFRRLAHLGLLTVHTHEGRVTRVTNGVGRNFDAPKSAELTSLGHAYFEWTERDAALEKRQVTEYADLV